MRLAGQTGFSRGVMWSTRAAIDVDLFGAPVFYSLLKSWTVLILAAQLFHVRRMSLIVFNINLYLVTLTLVERVYKGDA